MKTPFVYINPLNINFPNHLITGMDFPQIFTPTTQSGKNSVCISAIFTWNYLQNLHRNILFHKLTTKCLKKLLTLHFLRKYVWHDFLHNISSSYPYCLKDYRLFVQLKMAWNFIFAFPSGTWRGFGGDGMGLHEAFLVVPLRDVEMKIFILTFSLVQHWNRRLIININEFLTTSARAIPLVLASLCGNSPLTFNLFVYLLSTSYC